jgi:membrane protein insertase Oxa1/YidC/SpoIIIJ
MTTGGALWFTNLALPDPYYVLPVVASGLMLATVEVLQY